MRSLLCATLILFIVKIHGQDLSISGPDILCTGECGTYLVEPLQNPDFPGILWTVYDIFGNVVQVDTSYEIHQVDICNTWGLSDGTIVISDIFQGNNLDTFTVLSELTYLNIFMEQPCSTTIGSSGNCIPICEGTVSTFFVEGRDHEISWEVSGGIIIEQDIFSITVEWTDLGIGQVYAFGFGTLCTATGEACVEVISRPTADFTTTPSPVNRQVEVCTNQPLYFDNLSTNIGTNTWYFGDGQQSNLEHPHHQYDAPGTYNVLLVTDLGCDCRDTASIEVVVSPAISPNLTCISTLCPETEGTYYAESDCNEHYWTVSANGTILDGGGINDDYIIVDWTSGPDGIITLLTGDCAGTACSEPAVFRVPIISTDGPITGDNDVCPGEYVSYAAPYFEGVNYHWEVSGLGFILSGQGSPEVKIRWGDTNVPDLNQWVRVVYDNCYLDCQGEDTYPVRIRSRYALRAPQRLCEGTNRTVDAYSLYAPFGNVTGNWTLSTSNGSILYDSSGIEFFPIKNNLTPGDYEVTFEPSDPTIYCDPVQSTTFTVDSRPTAPQAINAPEYICTGQEYRFSVDEDASGFLVNWQFNDGGSITTRTGTFVRMNFQSGGPYEVSVWFTELERNCNSEILSESIPVLPGITLSGPDVVCKETQASYTADTLIPDGYTWTIDPPGAGIILDESDGPVVSVQWLQAGNARVVAQQCGGIYDFNVEVRPDITFTVNGPAQVCAGELARLEVMAAFTTLSWYDESGILIGNVNPIDVPPGTYLAEITDDIGCSGRSSFTVESLPEPEAFLTTSGDKGFCDDVTPDDLTLEANTSGGTYTYRWFFNGSEIVGATDATYVTNEYGLYTVEVTSQEGCVSMSNILELYRHCDPIFTCNGANCSANPIDCPPDDVLQFSVFEGAFCNEKSFKNSGALIGDFAWYIEDPATGAWIQSLDAAPVYTFQTAGYYNVVLDAQVQSVTDPDLICWIHTDQVVEIPVAARFEAMPSCEGTPVSFTDLSTHLPTESIASWSWNFGDPASGVDNESSAEDPTHLFTAPGKYEVRLVIEAASGCQSQFVDSVLVRDLPNAGIIAEASSCAGIPIYFETSPGYVDYAWNYGDPASGALNASIGTSNYHLYDLPGMYRVTLDVTDVFGCTQSITHDIQVVSSSLTGLITSTSNPVCAGDTSVLTAPVGGITWNWSTGDTTESIRVANDGSYQVTMTDADGCIYKPDAFDQRVENKPPVSLVMDVFSADDEFLYSTSGNADLCQGQRIEIRALTPNVVSFLWNNNFSGRTLFAQPGVGSHTYQVEVTDISSGCKNTSPSIEVIVHPRPPAPTITSSEPMPLCEGTATILTVMNYDPQYQYVWNTGARGESITVSSAGIYSVSAISPFGCETYSAEIMIFAAPNASLAPSGCLVRCRPDTICLPDIAGVASYQWYQDGTPVPAPDGSQDFFVAIDNGTYQVELTGFNGCTSLSDELNLELFDGFGDVAVTVFLDQNGNGIVDGSDIQIDQIDILTTWDNMMDQCVSKTNEPCNFIQIPAGTVEVSMDEQTLPPGYSGVIVRDSVVIIGCDQEYEVTLLVTPSCLPDSTPISAFICEGDSLSFGGQSLSTAGNYTDTLTNSAGCDSIIHLELQVYPIRTSQVLLDLCDGESIDLGDTIVTHAGIFPRIYSDINGCDSIVEYNVNLLPAEGNLTVTVYHDDNDNGVIDAGDTPQGAIPVRATGPGPVLTDVSNIIGQVLLFNIPIGFYEVSVDTQVLQPTFEAVIISDTVTIKGCSQAFNIDLLVRRIIPTDTTHIGVFLCPGDVLNLGGFTINRAGIFAETLTNKFGGDSVVVYTVTSTGDIILPSNITLQINQAYQINHNLASNPNLIYQWSPPEGLSCADCPEPIAMINRDITYTVQIIDTANNCEVTGEITLELDFDMKVYIPNAISPNDDGINDVFEVYVPENLGHIMRFTIFNRWGDTVFDAPQRMGVSDVQWDGRQNGQLLNPQVLVYLIEIEGIDGVVRKYAGDLTLVR